MGVPSHEPRCAGYYRGGDGDFDVLIVGAGIAGIGAACQLSTRLPGKTFAILEGRDAIGGTWDLFRYPGVRSDSDMHTFGYEFKPWTADNSIADGHEIVAYLREAAEEHGIAEHIRFGHTVLGADWSSQDARWTVRVERDGEVSELTCRCDSDTRCSTHPVVVPERRSGGAAGRPLGIGSTALVAGPQASSTPTHRGHVSWEQAGCVLRAVRLGRASICGGRPNRQLQRRAAGRPGPPRAAACQRSWPSPSATAVATWSATDFKLHDVWK